MNLPSKILVGLAVAGGVATVGGGATCAVAISDADHFLHVCIGPNPPPQDRHASKWEDFGFWVGYKVGYFPKYYHIHECPMCGCG